jgi:hypothetical protein
MTDYKKLYEALKKELKKDPYLDPDVHGPEFREEFHKLKRDSAHMKRNNRSQVLANRIKEDKIKTQEKKIKGLEAKVEEYEEKLITGLPLSEAYYKKQISKQDEEIKRLQERIKDLEQQKPLSTGSVEPITKKDFSEIIHEILKENRDSMNVLQISKEIWKKHSVRLYESDIFYTWQYDFRWAGTELRKKGIMKPSSECSKGFWELK